MKRRKLKPIPKLIFDVIRKTIFFAIVIVLMFYLFCIGLYVNAKQMDAKYEYLIQEMENR